jgi:hypothetical protein
MICHCLVNSDNQRCMIYGMIWYLMTWCDIVSCDMTSQCITWFDVVWNDIICCTTWFDMTLCVYMYIFESILYDIVWHDTVDGRNPAPVHRWFIQIVTGLQPSVWLCRISQPSTVCYYAIRCSWMFLQSVFGELHSWSQDLRRFAQDKGIRLWPKWLGYCCVVIGSRFLLKFLSCFSINSFVD